MSEHEAIRKALGMLITTLTAATMPKHHDEATARFRSRLTAYDITALLADRDRLAAEVESLRSFAQDMLGDWPDVGGLDGFDLQVIGLRRGLLREEIRHEPCGEYCNCAGNALESEWTTGVECYRKTPLLTGKAASPEEGTS